jgi:hypothetical protein
MAQKVLSVVVAADPTAPPPPPPTSGVVFQDDFENDFTPWGNVTDSRLQVNTDASFCKKGRKSLKIYYNICGDSTNPACRGAHTSDDHNVVISQPKGLSHFFLRAYFHVKHPESGGTVDGLGRKLFYVWADPSNPSNLWSAILATYSSGGVMKMTWTQQNGAIGGGSYVSDCGTTNPPPLTGTACRMQYDTWYSVEMEIQNNTATASPWNGQVRIWLNGEKVYDVTGWNLNMQYNYPIKAFFIGDQVDRDNYLPVNEYRYVDDVVLSTSYVGP